MAKKVKGTPDLFAEPTKNIADNIQLSEPVKKEVLVVNKKEPVKSKLFVEDIQELTEEQRKKLFPSGKSLTLRELKSLKNKR